MVLNKIYSNQALNLEDIKFLVKSFFKINKVEIKDNSIDLFLKYMAEYNEHPFNEKFHKFKSLGDILYKQLIPTLENYLEVTKIIKQEKFIRFTYKLEKFKRL